MIIVEPYEMRMLAREMNCDLFDSASAELIEIHTNARVNTHNSVIIPKYWSVVVLGGIKHMLDEFPQLKFGSIHEDKNRLRMFTVPTHRPVERLKTRLYVELDTMILNVIEGFVKSDLKPFFLK